jgi:hypothetical protein
VRCPTCEGERAFLDDDGVLPCWTCDGAGTVSLLSWLQIKAYTWFPPLGYDRHLWRRGIDGRREYLHYYCDAWCFVTNQKFCHKAVRRERDRFGINR